MRTEQLEYFVVSAETLSFTEAARRCHLAQPAISQQIHKLEEELGFELFIRSPRGLVLTDAGKSYYHEVTEVLERLDQARERAACVALGQVGTLTIGAFGSTQGSDFEIVRRFHDENPNIKLEFCGIDTPHQAIRLANGDFDAMYTATSEVEDVDGVRIARRKSFDMCLMASVRNPLANRREGVTFEEACEQTLIFAEPSDASLARGSSMAKGPFAQGSGRRIFTDTQENVQLMVRLDMGLAVAPDGVASSVSDDIAIIPTRGSWPQLELGWAYMAGNHNPALSAFVGFLESGLND
jgi:DNA-binding transcriptional LysR family regulator